MGRLLDLDEAKKNPDWQLVFGGGVNAGDASAVLEESPFGGAYHLWLLKTKKIPRPEQTPAMLHGVTTEPLIFEWYKKRMGMEGRTQVWAVYEDAEWIRGLGDFWNADARHGAEFKAPTRDDSGDHILAKQGRVPYHYWLQCVHLMEVYDSESWDFVSWRSSEDAAVIRVERDTDFWLTQMLPAYMEFWNRVSENSWPKPEGNAIEESEEWQMHAKRYMTAQAMKQEAKEYEARAKAGLMRMAQAKVTKGGGVRATWMTYKPRWEVVVSADSEAARDKIATAVNPLAGKQGVGRITNRTYPPNLILRVSEDGKA